MHGHPLGPGAGHDDETPGGGRRWALGTRAAAVAGAAVLVVGLAAGVVTLWPRGGVELLPVADGAAAAGTGASDVAPPGTATEASAEGTGAGAAEAPGPASLGGAAGGTDAAAASVVVHVVGQVAAPGIVTLPAGARVADALDAAGGPTAEADLAAVNLARAVVDGEQVYVPAPGEPLPATAGPAGGTGAPAGAAGAGGTGTGGPGAGGLVDLNTADAATLETLPGIGPVLAERIVAWRTEHGPFASVDELGEVSGIGPSILAGLRDAARV